MRDSIPVEVPEAHTSPPEDGFQLTGLKTWFWLDPAAWAPVAVRAEVATVWIEVTATPTVAEWTPGDGGAAVACGGPGREHPGTQGAETTCGHTYLDVGRYTIDVAVTWLVTWEASTGEGGTLAPLTLATDLPIDVQQRQVVIN